MYVMYVTYMNNDDDRAVSMISFRAHLREYLDAAEHNGKHVTITRRGRAAAVLVPPQVWRKYRAAELADDGLCAVHNGDNGQRLSRDEFAERLRYLADQLGGQTVQLSAGEADLIAGLLDEYALQLNNEPLGVLAHEWADRLATRAALD